MLKQLVIISEPVFRTHVQNISTMKHSFQGHEKFLVFKEFVCKNTNSYKLIIIANPGTIPASEARWLLKHLT